MRRRAVLRAGLGLAGLTTPIVAGRARGQTAAPDADGVYAPSGRLTLAGAADCRVSPDGTTAFVATGDGFDSVALPALQSRASVQQIAAGREDGPLQGIADLAVDGDRLLVPGPAGRRSGRLAGFALFDVSDPADPVQVAFHETGFSIHNAALDGGHAYLTAGRSLVVIDVTDDDPVEIGRWSIADADARWDDVPLALWVLHDVRVRDGLAVLSQWDAGTWLVDVRSPAAPAVIGRAGGRSVETLAAVPDESVRRQAIEPPGNHHSAALSADGSLLAVGAEAFDAEAGDGVGGPGGITLYDVATPSAPEPLATIDAPPGPAGTWTTAHDFTLVDDRLLSAWYQGGVRIHDVSDPGAPEELAWWRAPSEAAFWTARPAVNETFVATSTTLPDSDLSSGLYLFPNRPGEQADPPATTEPSPTTRSRSPSPTDSPTRTPGQPSFGPAAALGGMAGLVAWRYWRQR